MHVGFRTTALARCYSEHRRAVRRWGESGGKKFIQRVNEIIAVETLADLMRIPAAQCHALKGNREGECAVMLAGGRRLVFEPDGDPSAWKNEDGGIDPDNVSAVLLKEVVDYHG